jgi:hypothetical protein
LENIGKIQSITPIRNFFMTGDLLTPYYNEKSDVKIIVQIDPHDVEFISSGEILQLLKKINGRMAVGTTHPINYIITFKKYDMNKLKAVYDVINERWIKTYQNLDASIEDQLEKFLDTIQSLDVTTGEIRRNLLDIKELREMGPENVHDFYKELKDRLNNLEENLHHIISLHKNAKILRDLALDRTLTPAELKQYGKQYNLPENILYRLLKRYYYVKYIKNLEEILNSNENQLDLTNLHQIEDISDKFWQNPRKIEEKLAKWGEIKLKKPADPLKSHKFKMARGTNRKKQTQVPDSHSISKAKINQELKRLKRKKSKFQDFHSFISGLETSNKTVDVAKKSTGGIWKISKQDVIEIAKKYKFNIPDEDKPMKHLGSTGIQMIRFPTKKGILYYLYKPRKLRKRRKFGKITSKFDKMKKSFMDL